MKSAGKARNNGLYRHIRTSKEIIRNLLNDFYKNLNGSYNIRQIIPAHIGGVLCFLAIVDVTNLNSGATIDTDSSDTKRVFIIQ